MCGRDPLVGSQDVTAARYTGVGPTPRPAVTDRILPETRTFGTNSTDELAE